MRLELSEKNPKERSLVPSEEEDRVIVLGSTIGGNTNLLSGIVVNMLERLEIYRTVGFSYGIGP
jgi:hypothetical protein